MMNKVVLLSAGLLCSHVIVYSQPISPLLVGQNVWMNPDQTVWQRVSEVGVGSIRIGGISYDNNMPSRATLTDWVGRIKGMGAEPPILQVSRNWTAQQAAELVTDFNRTLNQRVTYWQIGNEPDLHNNPGAAAIAGYIKNLAQAMKTVDPTIRIYVPDCASFNTSLYGSLIGGDQDITGKDANGRFYMDGVTFHRYPFGSSYNRDQVVNAAAAGIRSNATRLLELIRAAEAKNGRTADNRIGWGLTEFNITWANPSSNTVEGYGVHSFLNGQFFAEVYGIGMANGATFMNTWSMFESGGSRNSTDLSFLDGSGRVPRSSYWHMQMIAGNFGGVYAAGTTNLPNVRAYGSVGDDRISVIILNLENAGSRRYTVRLNKDAITGTGGCAINIDAGTARSYVGEVPNQTTIVLVFSRSGEIVREYTYGIGQAQNAQPPLSVEYQPTRLDLMDFRINDAQRQSHGRYGFGIDGRFITMSSPAGGIGRIRVPVVTGGKNGKWDLEAETAQF